MGYMIMECGLGAFRWPSSISSQHGLFKATVFLSCGNVIHKARQEPEFRMQTLVLKNRSSHASPGLTGFRDTPHLRLSSSGVPRCARIPLRDSQGTVIFLFFIWVTSSQAILTLIRLRAVASWKVSAAMLLILLFVVFIYLFAVESFTAFLYPNPEEVASYFQAAAFPNWLF